MTVQHPSNAPVAWTGGTRPGKFLSISSSERAYRSAIFRKHVDIYVEFWGAKPPRDILRTYYNWARYDAHATVQSIAKSPEDPAAEKRLAYGRAKYSGPTDSRGSRMLLRWLSGTGALRVKDCTLDWPGGWSAHSPLEKAGATCLFDDRGWVYFSVPADTAKDMVDALRTAT